ncbi:hypothetical protein AQJ23_45125 [Streptomyces antibioticus]|nr:hypothetical protein AQJ23_45125 [Streptomyces antibioticus]
MIIVTGPQATDEGRRFIAETAELLDGVPAWSAAIQWAAVTALYCLPGWEACALAVADVTIAEALDLPIKHLDA